MHGTTLEKKTKIYSFMANQLSLQISFTFQTIMCLAVGKIKLIIVTTNQCNQYNNSATQFQPAIVVLHSLSGLHVAKSLRCLSTTCSKYCFCCSSLVSVSLKVWINATPPQRSHSHKPSPVQQLPLSCTTLYRASFLPQDQKNCRLCLQFQKTSEKFVDLWWCAAAIWLDEALDRLSYLPQALSLHRMTNAERRVREWQSPGLRTRSDVASCEDHGPSKLRHRNYSGIEWAVCRLLLHLVWFCW